MFPRALLQWEDFKKANAFNLLGRYQGRLPSFNDDIQGTSAVTLAGILSGLRLLHQSLRAQRFLLVGSGAAGVGIGRLLRTALEGDGMPESEFRQHLVFVDSVGLVHNGRSNLEPHKREVALRSEDLRALKLSEPLPSNLADLVSQVRPSVLIGTTGQPGDFTPEVLSALADSCDRPIILPLSNPTSKAECTPADALKYSKGRALIATGSPFEPIEFEGRRHVIGQCNNAFVFPGVGLGVLISEASRVTDSMFFAAAGALADFANIHPAAEGCLYPRLSDLREVSRLIAFRVARTAREEGFGRSLDDELIRQEIDDFCWFPDYEKGDGQPRQSAAWSQEGSPFESKPREAPARISSR